MSAALSEMAVNSVVMDCLVDEGQPGWIVEGVEGVFTFNLESLQANMAVIQGLLSQLPIEFRDTNEKAGAWSFLNAVQDINGKRWAPTHTHVDALFCLGIGVDLVEWTLPREEWPGLPGGFPYVTVLASKFAPTVKP